MHIDHTNVLFWRRGVRGDALRAQAKRKYMRQIDRQDCNIVGSATGIVAPLKFHEVGSASGPPAICVPTLCKRYRFIIYSFLLVDRTDALAGPYRGARGRPVHSRAKREQTRAMGTHPNNPVFLPPTAF